MVIRDEFYYINSDYFKIKRKRLIPEFYFEYPNAIRLNSLFSSI